MGAEPGCLGSTASPLPQPAVVLSLDYYSHEGTYMQAVVQPNVTRMTSVLAHNMCTEQMMAMTIGKALPQFPLMQAHPRAGCIPDLGPWPSIWLQEPLWPGALVKGLGQPQP